MSKEKCPAKRDWYFPDAYLPDTSNNISHESLCVLNVRDIEAIINLTLYYEDRDPLAGFQVVCPSNRTKHFRINQLKNRDGVSVQECVPYAIHVSSDVPVMCQYTRVDATKPAYTLMTTIGI